MKKMTWTRIGLSAGVLSFAAAGILVACTGDDENNRSQQPGTDSGTDTSTDSPVLDTSKPDTGPGNKNAVVGLVHAGANLGTLHACYAISTAIVGDSNNQNRPVGPLLPGIVGVFNAPIDLSKVDFTPFVLDTTSAKVQAKLAAGTACPQLVSLNPPADAGAGELVEGVDYFKLPKVAAGTLLQNKTFLLAVTGCTPGGAQGGAAGGGAVGSAAICGPNYDAGDPHGNLQLLVREVSNASPGTASGVQFAHFASEIAPLSPFVFVKNTNDAGDTFQAVGSTGVPYQSILPVPPAAITGLTQASSVRLAGGADASTPLPLVGTTIDVPNGKTQAASIQLEAGAGYWAGGSNYAYIIVGGVTGGSYNPFPDGGYINNHATHLLVVKATP